MNKNYDMIATVNIDLSIPVNDESGYDRLLIVGPLPQIAPEVAPPTVGMYTSLEEVVAAGWVTSGAAADPVGLAAYVAFNQNPRPERIYIAPIQMIDNDGKREAEGAVDTVKRAMGTDGWYAVCPAGVDSAEYPAIAAFIETQEKIFCYTDMECLVAGETDSEEVQCHPVVSDEYFRTMWVYGRVTSDQEEDIPALNHYLNVAMIVKWLQYPSGSETAAFKQIALITPSNLSATEVAVLEKNNGNHLAHIGNKDVIIGGKMAAGEWADIIRFRDWQKNDMQVAVAELFMSVPKVPFTDAGISLIQNQMVASLKRGQARGGIAEDEFDDDGNTIHGYATTVPTASSVTSADKANRILRNLKFKARLAGAIHFTELNGNLSYDL